MQVVPGHVYDEVDRLVEAGEFALANEAVDKAIDRYFDKTPAARFHCLWLFHRGAAVADRAGRPQVALAYLQRFIVDAEALSNQGPHVQEVTLKYAQIRPARLDEIAQAKATLPEVERRTFDLLKENLPGKTDDEIRKEVEVCKVSLIAAQKSGPCFIATAAFGAASDSDVTLLREFRDCVLVKTSVGRALVGGYEVISPSIARHVRADSMSGAMIRQILRPIIFLVRWSAHRSSPVRH